MRIIEKNCREGDSVGPAPIVNSPGPAQYTPAYISPNKAGVGATADKIEKQLSTRAGRLRESLRFVNLGSLLFLFVHFVISLLLHNKYSLHLGRCKNKRFEAQGLRRATALPSAAGTNSDSWMDGGEQLKGSGNMAAVARRRQPGAK